MAITSNSRQKRLAGRLLGIWLLALLMLVGYGFPMATACTVMRLECNGHLLVARNHDWSFGEGMLVVNKRGIEKKGISAVNPASWVSKYGSVSFVQFGREIPFAGMNERGLTVDILQLIDAEFPGADDRASVNAIQWLQYQLDTAEDVTEVVDSLQNVRPAPLMALIEKVHYFVTDAKGDVAVIEFLDGKAVVRQGATPHQCALANTPWEESVEQIGRTNGRHVESSLCRFDRAVGAICDLPAGMSNDERIEYAFESLASVAQKTLTQWSMVYEPREHRITFRTTAAPQRRWIDLDDLQFDPLTPVQILNVNSTHRGDLRSHLQPYSSEANRQLVDFAFNRLMPAGLPRMAVKQLVLSYPDSLRVAEPSDPASTVGAGR